MCVLTFKFDESYKNSRSLVVSGWIGDERQWKRLQRRWCNALAYENRTLPPDRKISRYHAAEMNANDKEFKGWENEGYRKLRFTKKLLKLVGKSQMTAVSCGIDLKAFREIFPQRDPPDFGIAYIMCFGVLMQQLGAALAKDFPPEFRMAVIHDHGPWDAIALQAYNNWVDDPTWEHRHRFVSITPLTWKADIGLQSSDLIAYESMRWLDDHLWTGKDLRPALKALLDMNDHVHGEYINRDALLALGNHFDDKYGKGERFNAAKK
jgi:hypothetical protein